MLEVTNSDSHFKVAVLCILRAHSVTLLITMPADVQYNVASASEVKGILVKTYSMAQFIQYICK